MKSCAGVFVFVNKTGQGWDHSLPLPFNVHTLQGEGLVVEPEAVGAGGGLAGVIGDDWVRCVHVRGFGFLCVVLNAVIGLVFELFVGWMGSRWMGCLLFALTVCLSAENMNCLTRTFSCCAARDRSQRVEGDTFVV